MKKLPDFLLSKQCLVVAVIILFIICIFLIIALRSGSDITIGPGFQVSFHSTAIYEIRRLKDQIENLRLTTVSKDQYEELLQRIQDLENTSINIGLLPVDVQRKSPKEVIEAIKSIMTDTKEAIGDTQFSIAVVGNEINKNWIINTRQPANRAVRQLNLHIQTVLNKIGAYNGPFDGKMENTYQAVMDFQSRHGLKVDGILGKKTWNMIRKDVDVLSGKRIDRN